MPNTVKGAYKGNVPEYTHDEVEKAFDVYSRVGVCAESVDDLEDPKWVEARARERAVLSVNEMALVQLFACMDSTRLVGRA